MKHVLRKYALKLIQDTPLEATVRDLAVRVSSGKGADYDRETVEVMATCLRRSSNCIDVGAYRGDILRHIVRFAREGEIHAIEPVAENCEYLLKRYKAVDIHNLALSDQVGELSFFHVLGRPARSGLKKQHYPDPNEEVREIKVRVDTLDNLIPAQTRIDFIKIDVEGAELNVLRGGQALIRRCRPVIVLEHTEDASLKFSSTSEDLRAFLVDDCGLQLSTMRRWLDKHTPLTSEEFHRARTDQQEMYFIAY